VAGRLIAVIDDDPDTREAFADWLEYGGDLVVSGATALAVEAELAGRAPAVCILDLHLGGTTGIDVFQELRDRLPAFHDTIPIVLTGMDPVRARLALQLAGMELVTLLTKPIDPEKLSTVIDGLLAAGR